MMAAHKYFVPQYNILLALLTPYCVKHCASILISHDDLILNWRCREHHVFARSRRLHPTNLEIGWTARNPMWSWTVVKTLKVGFSEYTALC